MNAMQALRAKLARLADGARGPELVRRLGRLIDEVDYEVELVRCYPDEGTREQRKQAITEFLNMTENYARRAERPSLGGFLEEVALAASDEKPGDQEESRKDAVTLMTLHAAKGLEFPHVYLVGMEEGILPHQKAVKDGGEDEERRLAYVGITRAQRRLTLTYAATRARFGKRYDTMPSRFLFEMRGETPPAGWQPSGTPAELRTDGPVAPPSGTTASTPQAERAITAPPPRAKPRKGAKRSKRRGPPRGRPVPPGLRDAMQRKRRR
jgi:superfamily I DNA/RNA helicase